MHFSHLCTCGHKLVKSQHHIFRRSRMHVSHYKRKFNKHTKIRVKKNFPVSLTPCPPVLPLPSLFQYSFFSCTLLGLFHLEHRKDVLFNVVFVHKTSTLFCSGFPHFFAQFRNLLWSVSNRVIKQSTCQYLHSIHICTYGVTFFVHCLTTKFWVHLMLIF